MDIYILDSTRINDDSRRVSLGLFGGRCVDHTEGSQQDIQKKVDEISVNQISIGKRCCGRLISNSKINKTQ